MLPSSNTITLTRALTCNQFASENGWARGKNGWAAEEKRLGRLHRKTEQTSRFCDDAIRRARLDQHDVGARNRHTIRILPIVVPRYG
jgi:hypothetical protein